MEKRFLPAFLRLSRAIARQAKEHKDVKMARARVQQIFTLSFTGSDNGSSLKL
jgi:hypothetical protein